MNKKAKLTGEGKAFKEGQSIEGLAEFVSDETEGLVLAASIQQLYSQNMDSFIEAKHAQIERLEVRLMALASKQASQISAMKSKRPKFFGGKKHDAKVTKAQTRLTGLNRRLARVKQIEEETNIYFGSKIEMLAEAKLKRAKPDLFKEHQAAVARIRREEQAKKAKEQERQKKNSRTNSRGRGLTRKLGQ